MDSLVEQLIKVQKELEILENMFREAANSTEEPRYLKRALYSCANEINRERRNNYIEPKSGKSYFMGVAEGFVKEVVPQ